MPPFAKVQQQRGAFMKKWLVILLIVLLFGCGNGKNTETGWIDSDRGVYYLDENGMPLTGWQLLAGKRCYFDPKEGGILVTGWRLIEGNRYYFRPDHMGAMTTGWLDLPEGRYYFDSDGVMQTGWLLYEEKQYYLRPDGPMAVGRIQIAGEVYHFTSTGEPFLLVNLEYGVPEDYQAELVELEGFRVSSECVEQLRAMMGACRAAGHLCQINTAYRDWDYQKILWDNRYNQYITQGYMPEKAAAMTAQFVLPPGHSEHHTGLAVDITGTEEMYAWLEANAPEYGFILRYPENETKWTGVSYEPWHFRYVGRALAQELQSLGITPEEYLYRLSAMESFSG